MTKLLFFVKSVITGLLLSDGSIIFGSVRSKNAYINLTQSMAHSGYMYFVFNILAHYCSSYPVFVKRDMVSHYTLWCCLQDQCLA